jgi:hypothetical protein
VQAAGDCSTFSAKGAQEYVSFVFREARAAKEVDQDVVLADNAGPIGS